MSPPLTSDQLALLSRAESSAITATTLRACSEMRWLEHRGLVALDAQGRFAITPVGEACLAVEAGDSSLDA